MSWNVVPVRVASPTPVREAGMSHSANRLGLKRALVPWGVLLAGGAVVGCPPSYYPAFVRTTQRVESPISEECLRRAIGSLPGAEPSKTTGKYRAAGVGATSRDGTFSGFVVTEGGRCLAASSQQYEELSHHTRARILSFQAAALEHVIDVCAARGTASPPVVNWSLVPSEGMQQDECRLLRPDDDGGREAK